MLWQGKWVKVVPVEEVQDAYELGQISVFSRNRCCCLKPFIIIHVCNEAVFVLNAVLVLA